MSEVDYFLNEKSDVLRAHSNKSSASIIDFSELDLSYRFVASKIDNQNKKSSIFLDNFPSLRFGIILFPLVASFFLVAILYYHSVFFLGHSYFPSLLGIGIEQVSIAGHRSTSDADIFGALQLEKLTSFLSLNASEREERLKGLPWVKEASIKRVWPNQLAIKIKERHPFGVWQLENKTFLIDEEGRTLGPLKKDIDLKLPMFSGEGAGAQAAAIWSLIQSYPQISDKIHYAKYIDKRRWSLKLKAGAVIDLPVEGEKDAIFLLISDSNLYALLNEPSCVLDLRFAKRIILRTNQSAKQDTCSANFISENKKE